MREIQIAREVAEQFFRDFCDNFAIDFDNTSSDAEIRAADDKLKETVVRAIMLGDLTFNDNDEPVYTPWRKASTYREPITFRERRGRDLQASDNKGKNAQVKQTYSMMASMCRIDAVSFLNLAGPDIKTCEALYGLLAA